MIILLQTLLACSDMAIDTYVDCSVTSVDDDSWSDASLAEVRDRYAALGAQTLDWNRENAVGVAPDAVTFDPSAFASEDAKLCVTGAESPQLVVLSAPVSVGVEGSSWIGSTSSEGELIVAADGGTGLHVVAPVSLPDELAEEAATLIGEAMGTMIEATEVPEEAWLDAMVGEDGVNAEVKFLPEQTVGFADQGEPEPVGVEVILALTDH